jgi:hypothetical protein
MMKTIRDEIAGLKAAVAALNGVTVEGYNKTRTKGGLVFGKGVQTSDPILVPHRTVVIAALPVAGDTTLTVREAKYADTPPKPCLTGGEPPVTVCSYAWYGDPFEVYPPLGKEAADYAGDEAPTDDSTPPDLKTVFHRCHREHDAWVLDLQAEGGAALEPVIILGSTNGQPTGKFLNVKKAVYNETSQRWEIDPNPDPAVVKVVETWHNHMARDYLSFVGLNPPLVAAMTKIGDTTRVLPNGASMRWFLTTAEATYDQSDCPTGGS